MALFDNLPGTLRKMFDEGLDEVLIFAIIFIIILLSGSESDTGENLGIVPILIIGVFLLIFTGICRIEEEPGWEGQFSNLNRRPTGSVTNGDSSQI